MPDGQRVNVTLDEQRAAKLSRLAARVHVAEGTLARSLLSSAIDDADPDPDNVVALLNTIPGSFDRAQLGLQQAADGDTIPLTPRGTHALPVVIQATVLGAGGQL